MMESPSNTETYIIPDDFLFTDIFHEVVDFILGHDRIVGEDRFVQGPVVDDDLGDIASDISQIRQSRGGVAVASDFVVCRGHRVVDFSRLKSRESELIPPADVDDGIW